MRIEYSVVSENTSSSLDSRRDRAEELSGLAGDTQSSSVGMITFSVFQLYVITEVVNSI